MHQINFKGASGQARIATSTMRRKSLPEAVSYAAIDICLKGRTLEPEE